MTQRYVLIWIACASKLAVRKYVRVRAYSHFDTPDMGIENHRRADVESQSVMKFQSAQEDPNG